MENAQTVLFVKDGVLRKGLIDAVYSTYIAVISEGKRYSVPNENVIIQITLDALMTLK